MLALLEQEVGGRYLTEIVLWSVPLLVACVRFARGESGRRLGWLVIAAGCAAIVADKAVDLQVVLHGAGQDFVQWVDPEHRMRGENAWMRYLFLGGGALLAAGLLFFVVRRDRHLSRGKCLSVLGLVGVTSFLALRLLPQVKDALEASSSWIEIGLWCVVITGTGMGDGTQSRE